MDTQEKVMKLRYSEAFYSVQGEGAFVGVPSVFLRTFGCNFRCQNFGLPRGTPKGRYNPEVAKLIEPAIKEITTKMDEKLKQVQDAVSGGINPTA